MAKQYSSEKWRPVIGYEEWYAVSDSGRIKRLMGGSGAQPGIILRPTGGIQQNGVGYPSVSLGRGTQETRQSIRVHRVVLAAFVGPCPVGQQVNHKNGVRSDNRLANLEYVTPKENVAHARLILGRTMSLSGEQHPQAKLTDRAVQDIRRRYCCGVVTYKRLASEYGVSPRTVKRVVDGKTWTHMF